MPNSVGTLSVELLTETTLTAEEEQTARQAKEEEALRWKDWGRLGAPPGLAVQDERVGVPSADEPLSMTMFWHDCK